MVAPRASAPARSPTRIARARNGASDSSLSHSGRWMFGSMAIEAGNLPPQAVGDPGDRRELAPLVVDGERVAHYRGGEAALRADPEALEVDPPRGLAHAGLELLLRLRPRALRRHQPEDHLLVAGHDRQRVERPRALVVV